MVCSVMIVLEGVVYQVLLTYYKDNVWLNHFVSQHHCLPAEVIRTDSRMDTNVEDVIAQFWLTVSHHYICIYIFVYLPFMVHASPFLQLKAHQK